MGFEVSFSLTVACTAKQCFRHRKTENIFEKMWAKANAPSSPNSVLGWQKESTGTTRTMDIKQQLWLSLFCPINTINNRCEKQLLKFWWSINEQQNFTLAEFEQKVGQTDCQLTKFGPLTNFCLTLEMALSKPSPAFSHETLWRFFCCLELTHRLAFCSWITTGSLSLQGW